MVLASWLAVFCLFGYRATFAILKGPMAVTLGWSSAQVTLGYSLMMVLYAVAAYGSGYMLDRWGTRPVYGLAALFGSLGFLLTARVDSHLAYLFTFGILGGVATGMLWVTSTVSVRKWYVGNSYATMWGLAFSGGPFAQFVLAQALKPGLSRAQAALDTALGAGIPGFQALAPGPRALALGLRLREPGIQAQAGVRAALAGLESAWRTQMTLLGLVILATLALAATIAKDAPERYGMQPHGAVSANTPGLEREWTLRAAFADYAIWAAILTFLSCMVGEFLIWTQIVSYWTQDVGFSLDKAAGRYGLIGLAGIAAMPLMGKLADRVVHAAGHEGRGRKAMLVVGPCIGAVACLALLATPRGDGFATLACILFAVYWAIVPGGVVGYTGAIYGRRTLGRIWGLATLIVMGIGPFLGSFAGASLRDLTGHYSFSIEFALGSFLAAILLALSLPLSARFGGRR